MKGKIDIDYFEQLTNEKYQKSGYINSRIMFIRSLDISSLLIRIDSLNDNTFQEKYIKEALESNDINDNISELVENEQYYFGAIDEALDEFSIMLFFKIVESKIKSYGQLLLDEKKISKKNFGNIYSIDTADKVFAIKSLNGYTSYNELRLLNNTIKHNDSTVSKVLAAEFSNYQLNDKLTNLHHKCMDLEPGVNTLLYGLGEKTRSLLSS